ncbi:MAG: hypothetical protein WC645_08330, partial [Candidatus Margulisiibacteriota bacterium]
NKTWLEKTYLPSHSSYCPAYAGHRKENVKSFILNVLRLSKIFFCKKKEVFDGSFKNIITLDRNIKALIENLKL